MEKRLRLRLRVKRGMLKWFMVTMSFFPSMVSGFRTIPEVRGLSSSGNGKSLGLARRSLRELSGAEIGQRNAARAALKYPPVRLDGAQARAVGRGFAKQLQTSGYTIWACAIMPEHTHLVLARHKYSVEQMANLLRGSATRQLMDERCHPLVRFVKDGERPPAMWAARPWKIYLDNDEAITDAIHYVQNNPVEEGKPLQHWNFVTPYAGIPPGHMTYH